MGAKRYYYIDAIRVVGMFFVILLHSSAEKLRMYIGTSGWHFDNFITSLATIAVPLFFMISGAVVLTSSATEDYSYVLKKRVPKLFLPLLMWSLVSLTSDFFMGRFAGIENIGETVLQSATHFFVSPVRIHFWFMYTLIPIYLVSPLLKGAVQNRRNVKYAAVLFFIISLLGSIQSILPAEIAFIPDITFIKGAAFGGYIYYFLLGYLLHTTTSRFDTRLLIAVAAAAWVIITAGTYWKSSAGVYSEIFKSYTGLFCIVLSCAVFLLFKNLCDKPNRIIKGLAPLSFGVYLIHNIIIAIWLKLIFVAGIPITMTYVAICFIATSVVSCVIIWALSKFRATAYLFCGIGLKP